MDDNNVPNGVYWEEMSYNQGNGNICHDPFDSETYTGMEIYFFSAFLNGAEIIISDEESFERNGFFIEYYSEDYEEEATTIPDIQI